MIESILREKMAQNNILLMTHIVIGYPDLETSYEMVREMAAAGVDLMELQIPFSEPIADGPVILKANQEALKKGATVADCLDFGRRAAAEFDIPFLYMTYYNILYKYGVAAFAERMKADHLAGAIVPDLPPEEAEGYLAAMKKADRDPIFIFAPNSSLDRMKKIADVASGFIYCMARKGVTGAETDFSADLDAYLGRAGSATGLPLAVGFGVREKRDVDFLAGKADIAVIGTRSIQIMEEKGMAAVGDFLRGLR